MERLDNNQMDEEARYLINYFRQRELTKIEAYSLMLQLIISESAYATDKDDFISVLSEGWDQIYKKHEREILEYKRVNKK